MSLKAPSRLAFCARRSMMMPICCLGLWLLTVSPALAEQAPLTVEITTMPSVEAIRPDTDLVRTTLTVLQHGQRLKQAYVQVEVTAPARSRVLSTDFPIVEGTHLLSLASVLHDGTLTFDYLFPIRGTYTVDLTVTPDLQNPNVSPVTLHKTLHLRENPAEVRNAWLLVVGLLILGVIAGLLFARSAEAQEQAAVGLAIFLALLVGGIGVDDLAAATLQSPQAAAGWSLEVLPTPERATVGKPVQLAIALKKDHEIYAAPIQVAIDIHHMEDDKTMFHTQTVAAQGTTSLHFQFFDGAEHAVTVSARPVDDTMFAGPPLQTVLDMEVTALHPPLAVKLRLMAILIGVLVGGILVGGLLLPSVKERRRA